MDGDAPSLQAELVTGVLARTLAARDLADLGIVASPADISAWLDADHRTRKRLGTAWAVMAATLPPDWKSRN
jgi:hypothetical protein